MCSQVSPPTARVSLSTPSSPCEDAEPSAPAPHGPRRGPDPVSRCFLCAHGPRPGHFPRWSAGRGRSAWRRTVPGARPRVRLRFSPRVRQAGPVLRTPCRAGGAGRPVLAPGSVVPLGARAPLSLTPRSTRVLPVPMASAADRSGRDEGGGVGPCTAALKGPPGHPDSAGGGSNHTVKPSVLLLSPFWGGPPGPSWAAAPARLGDQDQADGDAQKLWAERTPGRSSSLHLPVPLPAAPERRHWG